VEQDNPRVCEIRMCKVNIEINKSRITVRWLNRISGALPLIPIESIPRGGMNRCSANIMTNNAELKTFTLTKLITSNI